MDQPVEELRILLLEDVPSDAELEESELRDAELTFTLLRVDSREAFEQALDEFKPSIVLADYRLPRYNGRDALEYTRRTHPQIPVIMVTGAMGDEAAVELLKLGAKDYVLKDRPARLALAIKRALSEERGIRFRKLAEAAVRDSEERYRSIFENARDIIFTLSANAILNTLSPSFELVTGWSCPEWTGKPFFPLIHPDELPTAMHLFQRAMRGETLPMLELRIRKKSGDYLNGEITIAQLTRDGKVTQLLGIARDVSERKLAETRLLESEEKFHKMSDSAQDAIIMMDAEGKISFWNKAAETIFHYTAEEAVGQELHKLLAPASLQADVREGMKRFVMTGEGPTVGKVMEVMALRKGGVEFPAELSVAAMQLGGKWHSAGILRDITERKKVGSLLAGQLDELRRWHDATLGREMRTLELKREVNELLVKAGQPVRYPSAETDESGKSI